MERCYNVHKTQAENCGQQFVAIVAEKFSPDDRVVVFDPKWPKYADIYVRILDGLNGVPDDEPVYLCEDDTLYPDARYFWKLPDPQQVIYNLNLCYLGPRGFVWYMEGGIALSQLMGSASAVRYNIQLKFEETIAGEMACIEPCSGQYRPYVSATCRFGVPSVDLRTDFNASWKLPDNLDFFDDLPGWGSGSELWNKLYEGK